MPAAASFAPDPRLIAPRAVFSIAILEPDATVRLEACRVLERAGFAVRTPCDDASEPILRVDLLLADPARVSLAAVRRRYPATPVLAMSRDEPAPSDALLTAGRLGKPFTPSQLLAAVRLCLARPAATTGPRPRSPGRPLRPA